MEYSFFLEILAGLSCLGFGGSYLYMVNRVRAVLMQKGDELDNDSVLNFFKIYWLYTKISKSSDKSSAVIYLHFLSFIVMVFLIYKLQDMGL